MNCCLWVFERVRQPIIHRGRRRTDEQVERLKGRQFGDACMVQVGVQHTSASGNRLSTNFLRYLKESKSFTIST